MPSGAIGLAALGLAYFMSQFYRSFLAVLYTPLSEELGVAEAAVSDAQSAWWAVFAIAQFPIGWALDSIGPRRTGGVILGVAGAGGCVLFSQAGDATDLTIAMGLIGLGCAPVLMASYYIFARTFEQHRFATYAATLIGFGTLGNVAASEPLAALERAIGWRDTALVLAAIALAIGLAILAFVRDPQKVEKPAHTGGVGELLKMRALWLIAPMVFVNYAAAANLRSPWAGSFFPDVFALSEADKDGVVGIATFWMAMAMVAGTLIYGPLDRFFGTRKGVALGGNIVVVGLLMWLATTVGSSLDLLTAMVVFALIGAFGTSYPVVMAHGQAFLPPHLVGRGITLLNFFSIGGAAAMQYASSRIFAAADVPEDPSIGYAAIFTFYAGALAVGMLFYLFSAETNRPTSLRERRRAAAE